MLKNMLLIGVFTPMIFAEISAFDAGNVNIAEPYGLTENEKVLLENKKKVENLSKGYTGVDFKTNKALERIDGIQSVVDSLSDKTHNFEVKLSEIEKFSNEKSADIDKELAAIKKDLKEQNYKLDQLSKALKELTNSVNGIKSNKQEGNTTSTTVKDNVSNLSSADKLKEAMRLYDVKDYDNSAKLFEELLSAKHKPAQCNFYLGQIAYAKKSYKDAIYYYKTSSDLYKAQGIQAPNMPLILLNTANSLKALNETDKANNFYAALKKQFPNSTEAKSIN